MAFSSFGFGSDMEYSFEMNPPPRVSVIIATYNRSNVLRYSIGSALNQTFSDIEVLVVGDGCTDDSELVVQAIDDSRVRWIGLLENAGHQSEPNNAGLREARGEFVAYLGHDDIWLPHHLQVCVDTLEEDKDLVFGLALMVSEKKDANDLRPAIGEYKNGQWIPPSVVVHRKRVTDDVGGWKHYSKTRANPETDLWLRACEAGFKLSFVPRLSAIKVPAARRKDVYKTRNDQEQAYWYERVQTEADFEQRELAVCYTTLNNLDVRHRGSMPYRKLLSYLWFRTSSALLSRIGIGAASREKSIEKMRKYKGLKKKPNLREGDV
jgi:glycosyltransferase involved in cell wall biosynthesis